MKIFSIGGRRPLYRRGCSRNSGVVEQESGGVEVGVREMGVQTECAQTHALFTELCLPPPLPSLSRSLSHFVSLTHPCLLPLALNVFQCFLSVLCIYLSVCLSIYDLWTRSSTSTTVQGYITTL